MPIIDRYIVTSFLKIFLICFLSFSGLFIIIDAFTNLEEFLGMKRRGGDMASAITGYYGPRILQFFDRTAPLIALVAAIFTLATMQRSNEITAIAAGGISKRRIAKPILLTTLVIVLLTVVNRETLIPMFRNQLAMNAQDMSAGKGRSIGLMVDHATGIAIRGKEVMPIDQTIEAPEFTLPPELAVDGNRISADDGVYLQATADHPAGYLLNHVAGDPEAGSAVSGEGETIVFRPADHDWLGPDQAFVVADMDTLHLAFPRELSRYASLAEMIRNSRSPTSSWSNQHRVDIHWRILQPFFDMTILLIGLPLVISRGERNLFVSAGVCLLVVILMVLVVISCQSMGAARILSPPSLAAWLPLIVFVPVASVTYRLLDR